MRVLLLSPWLPWPPRDGARIRILETLRHLARSHRVTLVAAVRDRKEAAGAGRLADVCERVVTGLVRGRPSSALPRLLGGLARRRPWVQSFHYSPALARRVRALAARGRYDIVHVEFPFLAPYLDAARACARTPAVLSMHNIESLRLGREPCRGSGIRRRLAIAWDRRFFPGWEQAAVARFDGVTTVSDLEREWVRRHCPAVAVELVPNGVDTRWFRPLAVRAARPSIVFTGAMSHPPNVDGALWFCDTMWPLLLRARPELRFVIVGRSPHPRLLALRGRPGVEVTGEVEDVRPYLAAASVVVVPLRSGGGTRLKILEAMAMARPVVSTRLGAEGLEVTDGGDVVLADTPQEFILQVLGVLESPARGDQLGVAGRRLAETRYDWQVCLQGLDRLYDRLVSRADGERPGRAARV